MSTELALAASRFLHLAGLIQAFGALAFLLAIAPASTAATARTAIARLAKAALAVSLLAALAWFTLQSVIMLGDDWQPLSGTLGILTDSHFGKVFGLRLALLLAAALLFRLKGTSRISTIPACLLLAAALLVQPWLGHGAAPERWFLPFATAAHVIAAAFWLGALLPLLLALRLQPPAGALAAGRFSPFGIACVAVIALSGAAHWPMIGDIPRLVGTPYGLLILVKLALFLALLAIAAANRFLFVPRALSGAGYSGLQVSVVAESVVALLVVATAAALASLPPAAHGQPVWPFPIRPVPTLFEDAFLRDRLIRTVNPIIAAIVLLVLALFWRRWRWLLIAAAALPLFFIPDFPLRPYYRQAFPTTFQQWEQVRTPQVLEQARALFITECADCHAADGRGRGPKATGKPVWPPNLTAPLYGRHRDGDLFWNIRTGMATADGTPSMPGFGDRLEDDEIWMLVDFIRARAAAENIGGDGRWSQPARVPDISLACAGSQAMVETAARNDRMLLVAAGHPLPAPASAQLEICTLADEAERDEWLAALGHLTARDAAAPAAATVLIDGKGWLRRIWREPPTAPEVLAEIDNALAKPVAAGAGHHD